MYAWSHTDEDVTAFTYMHPCFHVYMHAVMHWSTARVTVGHCSLSDVIVRRREGVHKYSRWPISSHLVALGRSAALFAWP